MTDSLKTLGPLPLSLSFVANSNRNHQSWLAVEGLQSFRKADGFHSFLLQEGHHCILIGSGAHCNQKAGLEVGLWAATLANHLPQTGARVVCKLAHLPLDEGQHQGKFFGCHCNSCGLLLLAFGLIVV